MQTRTNTRIISSIAALVCLFGVVLPWWPLSLAGVLLAAVWGNGALALGLGLVLDLVYGAPTGLLHPLAAPFFILALVCVAVRAVFMKQLRPGVVDRV